MTFPETRVDLNRLIKKMKPELGSESFQNCKNAFSACTRVRTDGRTDGRFFFLTRPPRRIMTFPETRVDLNRLIKKMQPELGSESFQNWKNTFSVCFFENHDFQISSNYKSLKTTFFWRFQVLKLLPLNRA